MDEQLADAVSSFLLLNPVNLENAQRMTKKRNTNMRCPYCTRTYQEVLDSIIQQSTNGRRLLVSFSHHIGNDNTVVLCSQCSLRPDVRRGYNCLRLPRDKTPTARAHFDDVKEVECAVSSFELAKLGGSGLFVVFQTRRLKEFYDRHGFTGIAQIDEQFNLPLKEQPEEPPLLFEFPQDDTIWNLVTLPL
jgi:hypothetical protein